MRRGARETRLNPIVLADRAATAVSLGESHFREFKGAHHLGGGKSVKRDLDSIRTDIGETLVAFANADGGELLVGVEDDGSISGLGGFNEAEITRLEAGATEKVNRKTPLRSVRIGRVTLSGQAVLYFSVAKSTEFVHQTSDGRCLIRREVESAPATVEEIQFSRKEAASRQYDRDYVEGARVDALDLELVGALADQLSPGMSAEKCLQYLDLAEYTPTGFRIRRAALLLFAKDVKRWHPRCQVRVIRIDGTELGVGEDYNVVSDVIIENNLVRLVEDAWDALRPYLVQTKFGKDARFEARAMYPESACREALVNALAHRDYSQEGREVLMHVYRDRMEVTSPGALLSTITVEDLLRLEGVHQSRNAFIARVMREIGYMRELGEGLRRIFELMKKSELIEPELRNRPDSFTITLHHKLVYSRDEVLWLDQFAEVPLDRSQKAIVALGRGGKLISAQEIIDAVDIVDTEDYRQLISSLQELRVIEGAIPKHRAQSIARRTGTPVRQVPRFRIVPPTSAVEARAIPEDKAAASIADQGPDQSARLFVTNIPPSTTRTQLLRAFGELGEVADVYLPSGKRGYAFVEYMDHKVASTVAAGEAMVRIRGRTLVVRKAVGKVDARRTMR